MASKVYFDQIGSRWDELRRSFFSEAVRDKALAFAHVRPGQVAADIGAGTGFLTEGLVRRGLRVIAVDQSAVMLDAMRQRFSTEDTIDYRQGDAEHLPIDDLSVDAVFANMLLHHVENPPKAIAEMVRILKPGGRVVITDLDEHNYTFLRDEQHDRWLGFKRADVEHWLVEAGLEHVRVVDTRDHCCSASTQGDQRADVTIFAAVGRKAGASTTEPDDASIHDAVRQHYAAIASAPSTSSCGCGSNGCGSDGCCSDQSLLYDPALIAELPVDVTGLSLGCGDPVSIASLNPGEAVLDLGSGGGIDCFLAARQVGEAGYVIGVDMTPEMIARANASKARMGLTNVEFRQGQIEALPVDDESIDVILSNCVINLSPDKRAVFREAYRVLKPGGRLSVSDIVTEGTLPTHGDIDLTDWAACVAGAIDVEAYLQLLREAGFVDVKAVDKATTAEVSGNSAQAGRILSARITARKPLPA